MGGTKPWPEVAVGNKDRGTAAVLIIGGGISGMCAAIDLIKRDNCRNFIIVEKSTSFGGTWNDNRYPGACCDVWSTLYSYSFAQKSDWTREYPGQEEILEYLIRVAQEYGLLQHVRFNTSVEEAVWDDEASKWRTRVTTASGSKDSEFSGEYTISSDFLISAVGQLNSPKWPEIEGVESFAGKKMHSARWDWSYDLKDKKIALLGNGCTAAQILPEIAQVAKEITVFQRTPNWVIPRMDQPVSALQRNILTYLPPVRWRKRAEQMDFRESFYDAVIDGQSPFAGDIKEQCVNQMKEALPGQPDLWEKLTPKYNVGCKRVIISDDYYPALALPHVSLETRPIANIGGNAVNVTNEGGKVEAVKDDYDLLVCATGFNTTEFLHPIKMTGRNGRQLGNVWKNGAQAFYGVCVEDMPNFGMLYGPNTNLGHNSIILMIESQSRYISGLLRPILSALKSNQSLTVRPKPERMAAYNARIQTILQNSSFNDPNCNSWYKNDAGVITNNWSGTVVEYQKLLEVVDLEGDYIVEGSGKGKAEEVGGKVWVGRVREETYVNGTAVSVLGVVGAVAVIGGWMLRNSRILESVRVR